MSLLSPRGRRTAALLLLTSAALAVGPAAGAATAPPDVSGGCTDGQGVTVVLDLTELGGDVEVGCAPTAATGAEALTAAGFTDTRDAAGMICAIESLPDPCPAEFTGTYWTYWHASPGGDWQTYMEGADTAVPEPGAYEGWRYGDGSSGPTVTPADVAAAADAATASSSEPTSSAAPDGDETSPEPGAAVSAPGQESDGVTPAWAVAAVAVAGIGALGAVLVGLQRRRRDLTGPPGQD